MMRLEKFSEREFVNDVARLGGEALKQNATINAKIPDRLCWLPAQDHIVWFWAEWKRAGKKAMYGQSVRIRELVKKGHLVYVFENNNHAREVMRGLIGAI